MLFQVIKSRLFVMRGNGFQDGKMLRNPQSKQGLVKCLMQKLQLDREGDMLGIFLEVAIMRALQNGFMQLPIQAEKFFQIGFAQAIELPHLPVYFNEMVAGGLAVSLGQKPVKGKRLEKDAEIHQFVDDFRADFDDLPLFSCLLGEDAQAGKPEQGLANGSCCDAALFGQGQFGKEFSGVKLASHEHVDELLLHLLAP
jgi:hypothetical protein